MTNHQERVVVEFRQLSGLTSKLEVFIGRSPIFPTLDLEEQSLLHEQLVAMLAYGRVLSKRIARFE